MASRRRTDGLLLRALGDELVVFDTKANRAHHLDANLTAAWLGLDVGIEPTDEQLDALRAAELLLEDEKGDVTRRRLLVGASTLAVGGAAALVGKPLLDGLRGPTAKASPKLTSIIVPEVGAACSVLGSYTSDLNAVFKSAGTSTNDPTTPDSVNLAGLGTQPTPDGELAPFGFVFNVWGSTPAYSLNDSLNPKLSATNGGGSPRRFVDAYYARGYRNYIGYAAAGDADVTFGIDGYHWIGIRYHAPCSNNTNKTVRFDLNLTNNGTQTVTLGYTSTDGTTTGGFNGSVNTTPAATPYLNAATVSIPGGKTFTGTPVVASGGVIVGGGGLVVSGFNETTPANPYIDLYFEIPQNAGTVGSTNPVVANTFVVYE